jgi:DNA repair exonuclease SbcCD ATPase subunit
LELTSSRQNQIRKPREYYDENLDNTNPWDLHPSTLQYKVEQQTPLISTESVSSSVTERQRQLIREVNEEEQEASAVLGPATKKALESLKSEIEALNERIDGLRNELKTRDHRRAPAAPRKPDDERWEGWKWVYKVGT